MHDMTDALVAAWQLVLSGNSTLLGIVSLSLGISLTAVFFASCIGLPLGAALAITRFPGRNATVVAVPIVAAVARQIVEDLWREYAELHLFDGVGRVHTICSLLWLGRLSLITAILAGAGRAVAEVGAILIVGGNIAGVTRTMTTAIALETSRGDLALALGLGIILLTLIFAINGTAHVAGQAVKRAAA